MYIVFAEEFENSPSQAAANTVRTLQEAFARICCRCGYSYAFESEEHGWRLILTDVERPECSPEPIHSMCIKPRDAQHDLMSQAIDGRLRGHVALHVNAYATIPSQEAMTCRL